MRSKTLYFLRHGDTGRHECYIGSTDVPISVGGREQVQKTAGLLSVEDFSKVICSPMLRCRQTLELLDFRGPRQFNELIKEIDFGRWEGKKFADIVRHDKILVDSWVADPEGFSFPAGEAMSSFTKRLATFRTELEQMVEEKILVITHGGVIRHLICSLLGLDSDKYLLFEVKAGCFCSIRLHPEGGVLTGFNIKG